MSPREKGSEGRRPPAPAAPSLPAEAPGLPRSYLALALLGLIVYMGVMTLFKMSNNDIWIHLRTGEYVLKNGWVPIKDPYSFIASDRDYVAHEWLAGVLFYLVYSVAGVNGLIFFKAAILGTSCLLLILAARLLRSRLDVILPAFICTLYVGSARFLERPHIFSYLMAAVYIWLFFKYREGSRNRIWLYLILPAHAIWTNLHGGYVQGIAMVVVFALGEALALARARWLGRGADRALPPRDVALLALLVPGCILATLVNPYGWRLLTFPFELTGLDLFMQSIYEWQPPYHVSYNTSTMFFFYLIQVGALCAFFFLSHRDRTRTRAGVESLGTVNAILLGALLLTFVTLAFLWFQQPPVYWTPPVVQKLLFFILGLFCLFTVVNLRAVDFTQAGIFALLYMLSLQHNRAVTDAALGTLPILAASASAFFDGRRAAAARASGARRAPAKPAEEAASKPPAGPRLVDRSNPTALTIGAALILGVSAHATLFTYYFDFHGSGREKGFGIADNMPVCAVDYIARNHITGHAFVSYPFASMLIHRGYPDVKVNMDSRNDVYGEELYIEYVRALQSPEAMKLYLRAHTIDFFLLSYGDRVPAVFDYLESTGEWFPVYYDNRAFILVRKKPETEDLIRRETFKMIRPAIVAPTAVTEANAPQILEEAERLIRNCDNAVFGRVYKTKALLMMQRFDEAIASAREVIDREPANAQSWADLGAAYLGLGQRDKATEMFEKAVNLDPGFAAARDALVRLRGF